MRFTSLILFTLLTPALAKFGENQSFAVYWGQAEAGEKAQNELGFYCQSESVDVVVLAFISQFGKQYIDEEESPDGFVLNLSNMCHEDEESHMRCPSVEKDIKTCQSLGKKVLLSIGGEASAEDGYGFEDDEEAKEFAKTMWDYFGEGKADRRPFGSAVVDGFDFDIESTDQVGYLALAKELKKITDESGSKSYMFTAAPQCVLPEEHMSELLEQFELDQIYVQFYNNKQCELHGPGFNFQQWAQYIHSKKYTNTKLFIGLPSAKQAASSGFISDVNALHERVAEINGTQLTRDLFGGFMFWDASRGYNHMDRDSYQKSYIYRAWATFNDTQVEEGSSGASSSNGDGEDEDELNAPDGESNDAIRYGSSMGMLMLALAVFLVYI